MKKFEVWERIWEKSIAMSKSYHNWKSKDRRGSVKSFSKRKTELFNEVAKILREIEKQDV